MQRMVNTKWKQISEQLKVKENTTLKYLQNKYVYNDSYYNISLSIVCLIPTNDNWNLTFQSYFHFD